MEIGSEKKIKFNKKRLVVFIPIAAVLLVFMIGLFCGSAYSKVYPNTYVGKTNIGGLTYSEAKKEIDAKAKEMALPKKLVFSISKEKLTVSPEEISLKADAEKTVKKAFENREEKGVFSRAAAYYGALFGKKTKIYVEVSYDKEKLNKIIDNFAAPFETPPEEARYEINGNKLTFYKGHRGITVDKDALLKDLTAAAESGSGKIALKMKKAEPKKLSADKLYEEITAPAKDASYAKDDNGNVIIVADKPKIEVEKSEIKAAIESKKDEHTITVKTTPAKVTKEELQSALFCGTMGSWTSRYNAGNVGRSANVALAASRINGKVLLPGEVFSYDKTVGPRTAQNGFKSAGVYINNKVEQGIGGGICQTSSTLYSAVLYANLEIVTRTSHSLPVSYMPPGQDATIAAGSIDFKFKNNTNYPVKIVTSCGGGAITVKIVGTPVAGQKVVLNNTVTSILEPKVEIETDASIPVGYKKTVIGSKGSTVSSSRTVYQGNKAVSTQKLTGSRYNATPTVVKVNPADKGKAPETLAEYSSAVQVPPPADVEANAPAAGSGTEGSAETEIKVDAPAQQPEPVQGV